MLEQNRSPSSFCETCGIQATGGAAPGPSPKVSVVIGTFECEPFVEECIRSVMNQTEKEIEIIVVDDGSTDRTLSILKQLKSEDSRILVHSQRHTGYPGPGRNHGISCARGEYVTFLDGDDLYHPQRTQRILSAFNACPDADVVIHDLLHFEQSPQEKGAVSYLTNLRFKEIAKHYLKAIGDGVYACHNDLYKFASLRFVPFHTSAIAIRKEVLFSESVWFREDLRIGEDGDLWLRLLKKRRLAFVDEVISYYRQRGGSITTDRVLFLQRTIQLHRENLERGKDTFSKSELKLYKAKIADLFFDLGFECFRKLKLQEARAAYMDSLALQFHPAVLLAFLKTFVPHRLIQLTRNE